MRIADHMYVHHLAEHPHCQKITEALKLAITIMGAYEHVLWERDLAISQLEELRYSLGEKVEKDAQDN